MELSRLDYVTTAVRMPCKVSQLSQVWNATTGTLCWTFITYSYNMYCSYFFIRSIFTIMCDSLNNLLCSFPITLMDCEVCNVRSELWTVKSELRTMKYELWSVKYEAWCVKYDVWTVKYEVWSLNFELWSLNFKLWSLNYEVWTVKSELWTVK